MLEITDFTNNNSPLIIFGGTFNPIHNAHLTIANTLQQAFDSKISILPTFPPPYKTTTASINDRLAMIRLAFANNDDFILNTFEIKQGAYWPSYRTLAHIRHNLNFKPPIYFVIGADSLLSLNTWDQYLSLFKLANFIVISRPNYELKVDNLDCKISAIYAKAQKFARYTKRLPTNGIIYTLDCITEDISSTAIRQKLKNNEAVDNMLPSAVHNYIITHKLYQ